MIDIGKRDKIKIFDYSPVLRFDPNRIKIRTDNFFFIDEVDRNIADNISLARSHRKRLNGVFNRYFLSLQP